MVLFCFLNRTTNFFLSRSSSFLTLLKSYTGWNASLDSPSSWPGFRVSPEVLINSLSPHKNAKENGETEVQFKVMQPVGDSAGV